MREQFLAAIHEGRPWTPAGSQSRNKIQSAEYLDESLFKKEQGLFRAATVPVALETELDGGRPVLAFEHGDSPYLITKSSDGVVRGFINSCVHRGTRLLDKGFHRCKKAVACPYHNWTYRLDGSIRSIPHDYGFPKNLPGLAPINISVKNGIVWASPDQGAAGPGGPAGPEASALASASAPAAPPEINVFLNSKFTDWSVHNRTQLTIDANWKLIMESALEFYHFKTTHKATIYPAFFDNIGMVEKLRPIEGHGLKVTLPSRRIEQAKPANVNHRNKGHNHEPLPEDYSHILYYFFPATFVLVEDSLVNVMRLDPAGIGRTRIEMLHAVPAAKKHLHRVWDKRIEFTLRTLDEDYQRTKRIQETLKADPNRFFVHGSYEYGLGMFHDLLTGALT